MPKKRPYTPANIQSFVEQEIGNILFVSLISVEYGNFAAALSKTEGLKIFDEIESMFKGIDISIISLTSEWPTGKSAVEYLKIIAEILKSWLSNFRNWQQLVEDYSSDQMGLGDVKEKYQPFVLKNQEYLSRLDTEFSQLGSALSLLDIDFSAVVSKTNERIDNSDIVRKARVKAESIFNEISRSGRISRDQALDKLISYMGIPAYSLNFTELELGQCGLVLSWGKLIRFELGIR